MNADEMKKYIRNIKNILKTLREDVLESLVDLPEINTMLARLDARAIIRKLEGYAGAVNAMKEVFAEAGFKNVPVEVAMRGIEVFTLGQAQKYTPQQIEAMIRSSRNAANLTGTTIDNFILMQNHAAAVLRQANVPTTLANPITQQALLHTANVRGLGMLSVPSVYTPSDQQLTQSVINSAAYFAASPIARIGAVALRLKAEGLIPEEDEKNELTRFVREIERGIISDEFLNKQESELIAMLQRNIKEPQANAQVIPRLLRDTVGNAPFIDRLLPLSQRIQRTEVLNRITTSLMTEKQLETIVNQQIGRELENEKLDPRQVEARRNELLQILSRRISETLLDEMSAEDFVDERKRQAIIRQVIADTLKVQPSEVDNTLVGGLLAGAIPNLNQIVSNMSGGSLPNFVVARAVLGRQTVYGTSALRVVRDTRTEIQQRLQHLGSSDSIIANIMTTLQAAKPTDRLNLASLLIRSIGTQSSEEIADNMLPVVEKLINDLKNLEDIENEIGNTEKFSRLSKQDQTNLLRQYESLKQGVLQSISEIHTISKRYGLDAPMKRGPSIRDVEMKFLQSNIDLLALANAGYTLLDPALAIRIAGQKPELGKYMTLPYTTSTDGTNLIETKPAPTITPAAFEQFTKDKIKLYMRSDDFGKGEISRERFDFVTVGLGGILELEPTKDKSDPVRYNREVVSEKMRQFRDRIAAISEQGFRGINARQNKEEMERKVVRAINEVGNLFGRWIKLNDLMLPVNEEKLKERVRRELEDPESRKKLMNFLQTFLEISENANDPNYQLTEQDINRLLHSVIDIGYIIPEEFMQILRGEKQNVTIGDLQRLLTPTYGPTTGPNAPVKDEDIFDWYRYRTETKQEINPFIKIENFEGKPFRKSQVYEANRLLASLYLSSSQSGNLPKIEEVRKRSVFQVLPEDLQKIFEQKYQEMSQLDPNLRRQVINDFQRYGYLIRVGRPQWIDSLSALANYSEMHLGQYRFNMEELKNRLVNEGIFSREQLEAGGDLEKENQILDLLMNIHMLNRLNFRTFDYIKEQSRQIESKYGKFDVATVNMHLQNEVLPEFKKRIEAYRNEMLGNLNVDLIARNINQIISEVGGGQIITSAISTIASDIYKMRSESVVPGGTGNVILNLEREALFTGMMDRLAKYGEVMKKYDWNLEKAMNSLNEEEKQDFIGNILQIFNLYNRFANFGLERRMPGMLTVDAERFLRSPVLESYITDKGEFFNRQQFTSEQIRATRLALQHFIPEEAKRSAKKGDIGVAQDFTRLVQFFKLPIGPGRDLEKELTETEKVALVLMAKGYKLETLEELRKKLPQKKDPLVKKLLDSANPDEQRKAAEAIIGEFLSRRAEMLGIKNINRKLFDRIKKTALTGTGLVRADNLLPYMPFEVLADAGNREGRLVVEHLPPMTAEQTSKAFEHLYYQEHVAPYMQTFLQNLFISQGIDLGNDPETLNIVYQMLVEKENIQPNRQAVASTTLAGGLASVPHYQAELTDRLKDLKDRLHRKGKTPEEIDKIVKAVTNMDLRERLRNTNIALNASEALQRLASPKWTGPVTSERFRGAVSRVKPEQIAMMRELVEERNELIKKFSEAMRESMGLTEQEFESLKEELGITSDMHPQEQLIKLIEIAEEQLGPASKDPAVVKLKRRMESNLERSMSLVRSISVIGGERPDSPPSGRTPSQGGGGRQQDQERGRLLPPLLPGQGPAGQPGQNMPPIPTEPGRMDISGTLTIEGLGPPVSATLRGYGSIPSARQVR
jgi:hypothetical protein